MTIRKRMPLALGICSALLAMAACTAGPATTPGATGSSSTATNTSAKTPLRDELIVQIDSNDIENITNMNPYSPNANGTGGYRKVVYEPLFMTNLNTGVQDPWLALSFEPDAAFKVWTLKLRDGVTWADGKPFSADDVVATFEMLKSKQGLKVPGGAAEAKVTKVDNLTATIEVPAARTDLKLAWFDTALGISPLTILPAHVWSSVADPATFTNSDAAKGYPLGTGPYKLSATTTNSATYTLADSWWGAKTGFKSMPVPKRIVWTDAGSESNQASLMSDGKMDVGANFAAGTLLSLQARTQGVQAWSAAEPYGYSDVCNRSLDFNTEKAPWNDANLRWAVNYAIDRGQIINVAYNGGAKASSTIFPDYPLFAKFNDAAKATPAGQQYDVTKTDPAKAKQLIEAAGYTLGGDKIYAKDGKQLSLTITHFDQPANNSITATIVEQLTAVGIKAVDKKMTTPNFITDEQSGNFEAMVFFASCGSTLSPMKSVNAFNVSKYKPTGEKIAGFYDNAVRWNTAEAKAYGAIADQMAQLKPDDPKLVELYAQAMTHYLPELPSIPIVHNVIINPVSTKAWVGWPTDKDPYAHGIFEAANFLDIVTRLKPA